MRKCCKISLIFFVLVYGNGFALAEGESKNYGCFFTKYVTIDDTKKTDESVTDWGSLSGKVFILKVTGSVAHLNWDFFKHTTMPVETISLTVMSKESSADVFIENSPDDFVSLGSNPSLVFEDAQLTYIYTNDNKKHIFVGETHVVKAVCKLDV